MSGWLNRRERFRTSAFCADGPKGGGQGKSERIGFERTEYGPKGEIQDVFRNPEVTRTVRPIEAGKQQITGNNLSSGELAEWLKAHPC